MGKRKQIYAKVLGQNLGPRLVRLMLLNKGMTGPQRYESLQNDRGERRYTLLILILSQGSPKRALWRGERLHMCQHQKYVQYTHVSGIAPLLLQLQRLRPLPNNFPPSFLPCFLSSLVPSSTSLLFAFTIFFSLLDEAIPHTAFAANGGAQRQDLFLLLSIASRYIKKASSQSPTLRTPK